ncbi:NTP transferase domain-containing protein, partial [Ornithinicoccus halotolerans]|uniref:NTP transferase domain-containing protein n=1 Tax=Ornithinicoccus halotolerans TaxID=1748220 RepID=UPI001297A6FA
MEPVRHDAIVLVGGRARRLGGADKASLAVAGRTLLARALDAAGAAERTVVAGVLPAGTRCPPGPTGSGPVRHVVERPPRSGPVAGISAGLAALGGDGGARWVLVLAVDQPGAAAVVGPLLQRAAEAGEAVDGV